MLICKQVAGLKGDKKAVRDLQDYNNEMEGAWIMERLLSIFYFEYDSLDEFQISDSLCGMFSSLGDVISGDEKFFKFAGRSGYVRLVPNKPAKIGL